MAKKRKQQQRVGRIGESAFEAFAVQHHLIPTRPSDDFGFDFLCQVEEPSGPDTKSISGDVIGVSVRTTASRRVRVRIRRSDAETLLSAKFIVCLALVDYSTGAAKVYYRFLDEDFAIELTRFLSTERATIDMTPARCRDESAFETDLGNAIRGNAPERIRVAVARSRLVEYLPDASLQVARDDGGELTVVSVGNFYSFFARSDAPQRDELYAAVFGAPRLRFERLAELGPRPEVAQALARLPEPFLLGGADETKFTVVAENSSGRDMLEMIRVVTPTHTGWVHEAGFSITISKAKFDGEHWIHEVDAHVDETEPIYLADHGELWRFLERCTHDAVLRPEYQPALSLHADMVRGLRGPHYFASCMRVAAKLSGWEEVRASLPRANDSESFYTMGLLAEAATRPSFLQRFGFVLETPGKTTPDFEEVSVKCEVPIVGNLGDAAVVCWFEAAVRLLTVGDQTRGIRLDNISSVTVEVAVRHDKATIFPELVVDPLWPTVALDGCGGARSDTDASSWAVGLRDMELL